MAAGTDGRFVVFDDGGEGLWPLVDMRATFEVRTGAVTTLERLCAVFGGTGMGCTGVFVGRGLEGVVRERHEGTPPPESRRHEGKEGERIGVNDWGVLGGAVLLVNGRWVVVRASDVERHVRVEAQGRHQRVGDRVRVGLRADLQLVAPGLVSRRGWIFPGDVHFGLRLGEAQRVAVQLAPGRAAGVHR